MKSTIYNYIKQYVSDVKDENLPTIYVSHPINDFIAVKLLLTNR